MERVCYYSAVNVYAQEHLLGIRVGTNTGTKRFSSEAKYGRLIKTVFLPLRGGRGRD